MEIKYVFLINDMITIYYHYASTKINISNIMKNTCVKACMISQKIYQKQN